MNIEPLKNYVLLKALEKKTKTDSGIFLPETKENEDSEKGQVIACGPDVSDHVSVDQIVIFSLSTTTIKKKEDTYFIVREDDILAKIKN